MMFKILCDLFTREFIKIISIAKVNLDLNCLRHERNNDMNVIWATQTDSTPNNFFVSNAVFDTWRSVKNDRSQLILPIFYREQKQINHQSSAL